MIFTVQLRAHSHKIVCNLRTMTKSLIEFFCSIKHFIIYLSMDDSQNAHTTVMVEFLACRQDVKSNPVGMSPSTHSSLFSFIFQAFLPLLVIELENFCLGKIDKILGRSSALAPGTQKVSQ